MNIVYDKEIPYLRECFHSNEHVLPLNANEISNESLRDADALFVRSVTPVDEALLCNSKVHFVGSATAGFDHIDTEYLDRKMIAWNYAPGCNAKAVADYVLISVAHLFQANILEKKKNKAGVIGIGHVGQQVVDLLEQLGFDIVVNDPPRADNDVDFVSTPLEEFYDLDLVCIHTPLTDNGPHPTHHLIDTRFLSHFNSKGVLLNAGRGACVDTTALKQAKLQTVLDVWENEPSIDIELAERAFIATPHIAGYSQAAKYRATKQIFEAFCNHFEVDYYDSLTENANEFASIDLTAPDWAKQILKIENLMDVSNSFKQELQKQTNTISETFKSLRKSYPFRKEFMLT